MCLDVTPAEQSSPEIRWDQIQLEHEDQIVLEAIEILQKRIFNPEAPICNPDDLKKYVRLRLTDQPRVMFGVVFLNASQRPIAFEIMFDGWLTEAHVDPRQILERVLHHNAALVILVHNKPSGSDTPSASDKNLTRRVREGLALFDVKVLDHLIVGNDPPFSFAEHGLL